MKKAFIVGFCPVTRVVVDVPEDYKASLNDDRVTNKIIEAARNQIREYAASKLDLENCDRLEEDVEVPYSEEYDNNDAQFAAWKASKRPLYIASVNYTGSGADWVSDKLEDIRAFVLEELANAKGCPDEIENLIIRVVNPTDKFRAELEDYEHLFDFDWQDDELYTMQRTVFGMQFKEDLEDDEMLACGTIDIAEKIIKGCLEYNLVNILIKDVITCITPAHITQQHGIVPTNIYKFNDGTSFYGSLDSISMGFAGDAQFTWKNNQGKRINQFFSDMCLEQPAVAKSVYEALKPLINTVLSK